ncbi:unnamed protein product [Hermetia illucens]|uniref:Uncharacterized protein n=1 Tax=Hermetia illucens TaxID=343691 RepID=A0A7R8YXK0_HERIL|nr:Sjoegren syndrome nuclear autoantigen 1 homolog [Hermetia illucens]CAD7088550.1 unnamed protein product [Hermetia illucens]
MSEHGAVLQSYNQELVKHIENLKSQKEKIGQAIEAQEQERVKLIDKIQEMNARLKSVTASLEEKKRIWAECDKTLEQAEMGLSKIIESSQVLLSLVQQETGTLSCI